MDWMSGDLDCGEITGNGQRVDWGCGVLTWSGFGGVDRNVR